jgi:tetratricopeptide (TPR) repeat protein
MNEASTVRPQGRWRVFRPLVWWGILVFVLFLIRTHERLSARTFLRFEPTLAGRQVNYEASATLDGRRLENGEHLSIGWHTLSITHPKTKPFSTNLFIWYGERNLETIPLERATGMLALQTEPTARELIVRGPEFSVVLTNTAGITSSVPTDDYWVEARFKHVNRNDRIQISSSETVARQFIAPVGAMNITCNQEAASFDLFTADNYLVEQGVVPATVTEIPAGTYRLTTRHHGNRIDETVTVRAGVTNDSSVKFQYGALLLETEPSGAVVSYDGRRLGNTPLTFAESLPGKLEFTFEQDGYETVIATLEVVANQTNRFQTNLVSRRFTSALRAAQDYFRSGRYADAAESASEALKYKDDDPVAKSLQREAAGFNHLARGQMKGERGDFAAGITELNAALESIAENVEAKQLLADYTKREEERVAAETKRVAEEAEREQKRREVEMAERKAQTQITGLHEAFNILLRGFENSGQFQEHELVTTKAVGDAGAAIKQALGSGEPPLRIVRFEQPRHDIFAVQARQAVGIGYRDCFVVGSQVRESETRILFKVLEYDHPAAISLLGGALTATITTQSDRDGTRAARFQAQVKEGAQMLKEKIQRAILQ